MKRLTRVPEDLRGQRFGKLVPREPAPRMNGRPAWLCDCDCSRECVIPAWWLKSGKKQSCGYCEAVTFDPFNRRSGGLHKADVAAKANHDQKLLQIALDAVNSIAQTIRRIYYLC